MKEINDYELRFSLGQKAWSVYKNEGAWKVKECLVLGINLASKYCYFTDSDCGKYEHCEGELFGTKAEAEFAVEILKSNTGGIKEIPVDEVLEVIKAEKPDRLSASWLQRKFRIGYSRAFRLLDELRERAPKDGAD